MSAIRILLVIVCCAGCGERVAGSDSGTPDAGPRADSQPPPPSGPWAFMPEDDGSVSPAIALRPDPAAGVPGALLLVARGIPKLQGIAFRLRYDVKSLTPGKQEVAAGWYGSGKDLVSRIVARPEGELWGGIGYSGSHGLDASGEVVLLRLVLTPGAGPGPLAVGFRPGRNLVLDPNASKVAVSWLGGSFRRGP
jgi:hypothetical protein